MTEDREKQTTDDGKPVLEYVAGAVGFLLTLGLIGFIGHEALVRPEGQLPNITVSQTEVRAMGAGYQIGFEARNEASVTAAAVQIEAILEVPGADPVVSGVTIDYVPGKSTRSGGIFLPVDPASGTLRLRALGYSQP